MTDENGPIYSTLLKEEPEFSDLLERFIQELENIKSSIHGHHEAEEWEDLTFVLHNLKGCAGSFGYQILTDSSFKIENEIRNKNYDAAKKMLEELYDIVRRINVGYAEQN